MLDSGPIAELSSAVRSGGENSAIVRQEHRVCCVGGLALPRRDGSDSRSDVDECRQAGPPGPAGAELPAAANQNQGGVSMLAS